VNRHLIDYELHEPREVGCPRLTTGNNNVERNDKVENSKASLFVTALYWVQVQLDDESEDEESEDDEDDESEDDDDDEDDDESEDDEDDEDSEAKSSELRSE